MSHFHRPNVVNGQWVIKGTRVTVRTILATLDEGAGEEAILADFPSLTHDDIRAVIAFAAAHSRHDNAG